MFSIHKPQAPVAPSSQARAPTPPSASTLQLKRALAGHGFEAQSAMLDPGAIAAKGVGGAAQPLPHGEQIQRSFGAHDVSDARATIGGPAKDASEALQAKAFVVGGAAAFAEAPDLHTAAHEAAHVVQQRAGVSVPGGVGQVGDTYERQADQVADAVVAGKSAEALLGTPGGAVAAAPDSDVQRKWNPGENESTQTWDTLLAGLRWFYDSVTHKLYYEVADAAQLGEGPHKDPIIAAAGTPYTYAEWVAAGWPGMNDAEEQAAPREVGGDDAEAHDEHPALAAGAGHVAAAPARASAFKGAFRVYDTPDFREPDPEFEAHMGGKDRESEVVIAVLDTGIVTKSDYLAGHVKGAHDASGKKKSGAAYAADIKDFHGTKVAGQAAFGSEQIKLLDVRVQTGQIGAEDNSAEIAEGIRWAVGQGARVVTSSVALDWSRPAIQAAVDSFPNVIFLTSAGNNDARQTERSIDGDAEARAARTAATGAPERDNALLVGGVTLDGDKHPSRGYGPAVDVMVPSGSSQDGERALPVHMPHAVQAHEQIPELERALAKERERHAGEVARRDAAVAAGKPAGVIANAQKAVTRCEQEIAKIEHQLAQLHAMLDSPEATIGGESGVSFGIPVIANIAAKMILINPDLTAADIKRILVEVAVSHKEGQEGLSRSGGMVDPEAAYAAAAG